MACTRGKEPIQPVVETWFVYFGEQLVVISGAGLLEFRKVTLHEEHSRQRSQKPSFLRTTVVARLH